MRIRKAILALVLSVALVCPEFGVNLAAAQTEILENSVSKASEDCTMVGIYGSFYTDAQAALDRINEIRREACEDGDIPNPADPSSNLTASDYVPVKWSNILETAARLRAAEAAMIRGHIRPNGGTVFYVINEDGSNYEDLAWNSMNTTSMLTGINQWYTEKEIYRTSKEYNSSTGHYVSMIDPDCKYVGLGLFLSEDASRFRMTLAARFSIGMDGTDETMQEPKEHIIQKLNMSNSLLSSELTVRLGDGTNEENQLTTGTREQCFAMKKLSGSLNGSTAGGRVSLQEGVTWTSSAPEVISVDEKGQLFAKSAGTATITAQLSDGSSAGLTINVSGESVAEPSLSPEETDDPWGGGATSSPEETADPWGGGGTPAPTETSDPWNGGVTPVPEESSDPWDGGATGMPSISSAPNGPGTTSIPGTTESPFGSKAPSEFRTSSPIASASPAAVMVKPTTTPTVKPTKKPDSEKGNDSEAPQVKKVKRFRAVSGRGRVTLRWKRVAGANGYILQLSTAKDFSDNRTIRIKKNKTLWTVKGLQRGKRYYIRIRAYRNYQASDGNQRRAYGKYARLNKRVL